MPRLPHTGLGMPAGGRRRGLVPIIRGATIQVSVGIATLCSSVAVCPAQVPPANNRTVPADAGIDPPAFDGASGSAHALPQNTVPSIIGLSPNEADQLLRFARLEGQFGVFYIAPLHWRPKIIEERVYLQGPRAGSSKVGAKVVSGWTFKRASDDQQVIETPSVLGMSREQASKRLESVGLSLIARNTEPTGSSADPTDAKKPANVLDQYPRPGQRVYVGTSVCLKFEQK